MKNTIATLVAIIAMVAGVVTAGFGLAGTSARAEGNPLPGMCNGRTEANVVLIAHANGINGKPAGVPKYILNLYTDASGQPFGALVLGQGKARLQVDEWCRLWYHRPGDTPQGGGQCEDDEGHEPGEGAINAHAVGIGRAGGKSVLVRTDVRQTEEGMFFRVRYRDMGQHHEELLAAAEDDGCDDDNWTRVPVEGWAPLDQLRLTVSRD